MNNPLVSVVVPIYNMGDKIELCVKSLLCQDYSNFEVILVDDDSDENYDDILRRYKYDRRFRYIKLLYCKW